MMRAMPFFSSQGSIGGQHAYNFREEVHTSDVSPHRTHHQSIHSAFTNTIGSSVPFAPTPSESGSPNAGPRFILVYFLSIPLSP